MEFVHVDVAFIDDKAKLPIKQHKDDACYDLYTINSATIEPHGHHCFNLGIKMEIPRGFVGIIKGRSGLTKKGIIVPTGTIDNNYRGEIGVTVFNTNDTPFMVESGYRIAQFTVQEMTEIGFRQVKELLTDTDRGTDGFGSTGTF